MVLTFYFIFLLLVIVSSFQFISCFSSTVIPSIVGPALIGFTCVSLTFPYLCIYYLCVFVFVSSSYTFVCLGGFTVILLFFLFVLTFSGLLFTPLWIWLPFVLASGSGPSLLCMPCYSPCSSTQTKH